MFETHEDGRRKSVFNIPGTHCWDYVSLPVRMPWIYVTCAIHYDKGFALTQSFILADVSQLIDLAHRENVEVSFVDIVTPGHINETERWKMEPLREIWIRVNKEFPDQYEQVYVLESGGSYTDIAVPPADNTAIDRLIFKI